MHTHMIVCFLGQPLADAMLLLHWVTFVAMHLQKQKVYVQDRLRESGELVWKLLQGGGHFYVCGDAAHMAGSVEQALLHIIDQHQVQQAVGC